MGVISRALDHVTFLSDIYPSTHPAQQPKSNYLLQQLLKDDLRLLLLLLDLCQAAATAAASSASTAHPFTIAGYSLGRSSTCYSPIIQLGSPAIFN